MEVTFTALMRVVSGAEIGIRKKLLEASRAPPINHRDVGLTQDPRVAIVQRMRKPSSTPRRRTRSIAAQRLYEAERLFLDFRELTPYRFRPMARTFVSFEAYERWKRAQTNPWYR